VEKWITRESVDAISVLKVVVHAKNLTMIFYVKIIALLRKENLFTIMRKIILLLRIIISIFYCKKFFNINLKQIALKYFLVFALI